MNFFDALASLRPKMNHRKISDIMGGNWEPNSGGWIKLDHRVLIQIDQAGEIGSLEFLRKFPTNKIIEGLNIWMPLDEVLISNHRFKFSRRKWPFRKTIYSSQVAGKFQIDLTLTQSGFVDAISLVNPSAEYSLGAGWLEATPVNIPIASYGKSKELLLDWSFGLGDKKTAASYSAYIGWLVNKATSADYHVFACNWNWDYGIEPLFWIISQDNCDLATALHVFYFARPGQLICYKNRSEVPYYLLDSFDLTSEIRSRFLNNCYQVSNIEINAAHYFEEEAYLPEENVDPNVIEMLIPKGMRAPIFGRAASSIPEMELSDFTVLSPVSKIVPPPLTQLEIRELLDVHLRSRRQEEGRIAKFENTCSIIMERHPDDWVHICNGFRCLPEVTIGLMHEKIKKDLERYGLDGFYFEVCDVFR